VAQRDRRRWEQMIENYIRKRESLNCLFVLIDSSMKPQAIDLDFVYKLVKWKVPFAVIFTKTDKDKRGIIEKNAETFLELLAESGIEELHYFYVSALNKEGQKALLTYISTLLSNFTHKF
jgi:GTP-binding protein